MILVVGGRASGKRTYVESLGYAPDDMADGVVDERPVVLNAQEVLRDGCASEDVVATLSSKQVVSFCEIGSGIVPLDPAERAWRETAGRACNVLAARADTVIRMVCGIPVVLK